MKISSLKPGMVVYDVGRTKMGNTMISTVSVWGVKIFEVHESHVLASWNGNSARKYFPYEIARWRKSEPVLIRSGFGHRLATREELKTMKGQTQ